MNRQQQIQAIQSMARRRTPSWLKWILALVAVGFLALGLYRHDAPYFIGSAVLALFAYSAHRTKPHIDAAVQAISYGKHTAAVVHIQISRWSDSDRYYVSVPIDEGGFWRFEFIPLGWEPTAGECQAIAYKLHDLEWPALVSTEDGIMFPRYAPRKYA